MLGLVQSSWHWLRGLLVLVFYHLRAVTIVLLLTIAGLQTSQGMEFWVAMVPPDEGIPSDKSWWVWNMVLPIAAMAVWAFLIQHWSRRLLGEREAKLRSCELVGRVYPWTGCFYVFVAFIVVPVLIALPGFLSAPEGQEVTISLIVFTLIFPITLFIAWRLQKWRKAREALRIAANRIGSRSSSPLSRIFLALTWNWSLAAFVVMSTLFAAWPGQVGQYLTTPTVAFAFLAILVSLLCKIAQFGDKHGLPALSILVLWMLVGGYINRDTYLVHGSGDVQGALQRESFDNWIARYENEDSLYVVATAGGGLRAAYWTAAVLSELEIKRSELRQQVVAISSVSGGSLGAAAWILKRPTSEENPPATQVLEADFLSAALGGMFFTETTQKLLMWHNWPLGVTIPDRGDTLEESWIARWPQVKGGKSSNDDCKTPEFDSLTIESSLEQVWYCGSTLRPEMPLLLTNSTDALTGKRVIASAVDMGGIFQDSFDFVKLFNQDFKLSTSVLNSARFTLVSPSGNVPASGAKGPLRLVDGGYFENFGAETALELAHKIRSLDEFKSKKITVIQISSDPELTRTMGKSDDPTHEDCVDFVEPEHSNKGDSLDSIFYEILTPVTAVAKTREARGLLAAKRLRCFAKKNDMDYFHFRLDCVKEVPPPLGWLLSPTTREGMRELARERVKEYLDGQREYKPRNCSEPWFKEQWRRLERKLGEQL